MAQSINRTQLNENLSAQSLSALVDGEATELEIHRLLAESQRDDSVRERWHRYQLARAALKGEFVDLTTTGFADRIRDEVAGIPFDNHPGNLADFHHHQGGRWKSNAGRVAIAASVAAAVLIGSQQMNLLSFNSDEFNSGESDQLAQQPAEPVSSMPSSIHIPTINVQNVSGGDVVMERSRLPQSLPYSPNVAQQQLQDEQIRRYIRQLMLEHAEHSAQNAGAGLLPYARVPVEDER